jgi:hypothetical protein
MTTLLEEAIGRLRRLPRSMQDDAARALIFHLDADLEAGDREAIEDGRHEFERGDFVTLEQWRHDTALADRWPGQATAPSPFSR